jgi:hypothetical protein
MMRTVFTTFLALPFLLAGPGLVPGARAATSLTPAERKRAEDLIRQLGDPSYPVREEASKALYEMGLAVKDLLIDGSSHADLEVRRRCQELLPRVLEADHKARLEAFLDDEEGKGDGHGLAGWERYRKLAGTGPEARKLFAQMQKGDSARFLQDIEATPDRAGEILVARAAELQQRMYGTRFGLIKGGVAYRGSPTALELPDIASLVCVAADPEVNLPNTTAYYNVGNFLQQPASRSGLGSKDSPTPYRKLVLAWMKRGIGEGNTAQYVINIATNIGIAETGDLAVEALRKRKITGRALGYVLVAIGKMGEKKHVPILESYLKDKDVVITIRVNKDTSTTQVRDVALAMLVHLTGQPHAKYGFFYVKRFAAGRSGRVVASAYKFNPYYLGFTSDAERAAAFKKWQEYKAREAKGSTKK